MIVYLTPKIASHVKGRPNMSFKEGYKDIGKRFIQNSINDPYTYADYDELLRGRGRFFEKGTAVLKGKWMIPLASAISGKDYMKQYKERTKKGKGVDIHEIVGKLPKPKSGFTLPGHNYTGPYNPLDQQLKYDPNTGAILEIYQQPTGKTDAVAMQHDVDYSVCGNDKKSTTTLFTFTI